MERNLNFKRTLEVAEFKSEFNVAVINVFLNTDNKPYFRATINGEPQCHPVSQQTSLEAIKANPVISEVESIANGEVFFMMHARGEGAHTLAFSM